MYSIWSWGLGYGTVNRISCPGMYHIIIIFEFEFEETRELYSSYV